MKKNIIEVHALGYTYDNSITNFADFVGTFETVEDAIKFVNSFTYLEDLYTKEDLENKGFFKTGSDYVLLSVEVCKEDAFADAVVCHDIAKEKSLYSKDYKFNN